MRRYHEWVGHPLVSDRYATLYNPLDPKDFEGRSAQRACEMVVGRYSRADDKKWHPWCYEMYPALARTLPAAQYNIAGATPTVTQFIAEHGLENRVNYLPLTHDRQALMGYLDTMNVFARLRHRGEFRDRHRRSHGFRTPGRNASQPRQPRQRADRSS